MKNTRNGFRSVWFAGIVVAWLLCANLASGDSIIDIDGLDVSMTDDGTNDLLASDLDGWFSTSDAQQSFPAEPDPSQPWTSPVID